MLKESVLFVLGQHFLLPTAFAALGAFHISCSSYVHGKEHLLISRNIFMAAAPAFIIPGLLLD